MSHDVSKSHGCNATVTWSPDAYPATVNDLGLWENVGSKVAAEVSDTKEVAPVKPTMGAEDFSFLAKGVPANFFVYYEIDDDECKHALALEEYGHAEQPNAWVLLEAEAEA